MATVKHLMAELNHALLQLSLAPNPYLMMEEEVLRSSNYYSPVSDYNYKRERED